LESVDGVRFDDRVGEARRQALEGALLGAEDAWVEVGVTRSGEPKVFKVVRRRLLPDVITGWRRDEDNRWRFWLDEAHGIAYARVVSFRPHTDEAFDEALSELVGLRAVILDLRGNPGGDVNAAVNLMDRFVAHGWLARLEGRVMPDVGSDVDPETGERLAAWNEAIPGHALEGVPLAILVDRFSASSAEIVAGGLQELVGADVIGERTVGKGLSQVLRADPEGRYALQFTNLYWALPSGQRIDAGSAHGGGVLPAIVDPLSPAEQFWVSVLERRRGAVRQHADGSPVLDVSTVGRPDLPVLDRDPHVRRAHLLLRARQVLEGVEREP